MTLTMAIQAIIDQILELILKHHRISAKSIDEQLGILCESVRTAILEDLDISKFSAKWVLKCVNEDKKFQRCQSSEQCFEISA
jgi:hypothetical protein